jgi:hypothetical protein
MCHSQSVRQTPTSAACGVDSELNIAMPPLLLLKIGGRIYGMLHTGKLPSDSQTVNFDSWKKIMAENYDCQRDGKPLKCSLVEFYDEGESGLRAD